MKQLLFVLFMNFIISVNAQYERKLIDSSFIIANFVIKNPQTEKISQVYGKDFKIKLRTNITELTPLVNSEYLFSGAILGIVNSYLALIENNRVNPSEITKKEILNDLLLLKEVYDIGFTKEENNFITNKDHFQLAYSYDKYNTSSYAVLKEYYNYFLSIYKFYYWPTHPSYLACLDRTLVHFVKLRNIPKKKNEPVYKRLDYYNNDYFDLFNEKYDLILDLIKRTESSLFKPDINEELTYKLVSLLPHFSADLRKRKFETIQDLAIYFDALVESNKIRFKLANYYLPDAFTCLNIIYLKYDNFHFEKEGIKPETEVWFKQQMMIVANQFLTDFENKALYQQSDSEIFNLYRIYHNYDPENTIDNRNRYGPEFDRRFVQCLISALKISYTKYKTWREMDLSLYYSNLEAILSGLHKFYIWEKDSIGLSKVNNCISVLKTEKTVKAGEVKDAIDAL